MQLTKNAAILLFKSVEMYKRLKTQHMIWGPPSLSELTPMVCNMGLTHLDSETSI